MKKITEKELNCRDNDYIDHIEGEVWKTIEEYPNYIISNMGRVFSTAKNKILKPYSSPFKKSIGYFRVKLKNKIGEVKNIFLHRVVAVAYVENTENKPIIHHIDHNGFNNRADNLMWVTADEHTKLHTKDKKTEKRK